MPIKLITFADLKAFVEQASMSSYEVLLLQNNYRVNGKSIMGIMSLDLTQPITLNCDYRDAHLFEQFVAN